MERESKKIRRFYSRVRSGFARGGVVRMMTLTSSLAAPPDIHRSFRALKERIRRRGYFEYVAVVETTAQGLLHLHILWRGSYLPQSWLSYSWDAIHSSPIVWVAKTWGSRGTARYLAKYLAKEVLARIWYSWGWIYRGWRVVWRHIWAGINTGLSRGDFGFRWDVWNRHLGGIWCWFSGGWIPPSWVIQRDLKDKPRGSKASLVTHSGLTLAMDWVSYR